MALKTQAKCSLFAWALLIYMGSANLSVSNSHAAEAILNIGATIIQCGPRTNLIKACEEKEICCAFLDTYQIADSAHKTTIEEEIILDPLTGFSKTHQTSSEFILE